MDFRLINTEDTISRLLSLIRDARDRVVLVSPYTTLAAEDRVGRALSEALARKVKVMLFVREDDQTQPRKDWLEALQPLLKAGLKLYGVPGLHAKLYLSESTALVTSLNLLASSFLNTIEVGLCSDEKEAVKQAEAFIQREILPHARQSSERAKKPPRSSPPATAWRTRTTGHCIRCAEEIALKADKPYCRDCYDEWADWGNPDYLDAFCHSCGVDHPSSMNKPLCRDCYRAQA
ncbi:hypothetical protein KRR26_15160 [Corallococcus sp. M34]|uniref:phospholipase D-like domain-containing protein n=1 Tax=Citreicoccus inhibens TaxID=2849499 RepID=UPI001C2335E7|nr:phospholipase D family protein [Citreicoccus inhibens]MBU8896957.1 hypothetical protein [Citreicoccus inhibens]